jgi:hypothetical protein
MMEGSEGRKRRQKGMMVEGKKEGKKEPNAHILFF